MRVFTDFRLLKYHKLLCVDFVNACKNAKTFSVKFNTASHTKDGTETVTLSDGKQLRFSLSTGTLARSADGNVVVSLGGTRVMVTAVCKSQPAHSYRYSCDGRSLSDLRQVSGQVNLMEDIPGTAIFCKSETAVKCMIYLDWLGKAFANDFSTLISGMKEKNFFHDYEFSPFATYNTLDFGRVSRREIEHGALTEKALQPILTKDYPFTIRLSSDVRESNGSSSMDAVCAGSLALLDTGVPIVSPVAGVAMGLVTSYNDNNRDIAEYKILTDILGIEDYLGDMDLKVAGTKRGFTAFQLDLKIPGIPLKIIMECINQATDAKNEIIKIMNKVIQTPRQIKKDMMPVVENFEVPIHQRGKFLGIERIKLNKLLRETSVQIYPSGQENTYSIFADDESAMAEVKEIIEAHLKKDPEPTLEFGAIYTAKIVEIREFGVMVTLYSNMRPALLPNSQLDQRKIHHPSALGLEVGQEIQVKYCGRNRVTGEIRISRKMLQKPVLISETLHRDNAEKIQN